MNASTRRGPGHLEQMIISSWIEDDEELTVTEITERLYEPGYGTNRKAKAEQLNADLEARVARLESILRRGLDRVPTAAATQALTPSTW